MNIAAPFGGVPAPLTVARDVLRNVNPGDPKIMDS